MTNTQLFITTTAVGGVIVFLLALPWFIKLVHYLFKKTNYTNLGQSSKIRLVHSLNEACTELSGTKTGAIITIIRKESLDNFRTDGLKINANISSALMIALFRKDSPLHDGAIIIEDNRITYAGTYYKITAKSIDNKYGARHRAALGISEQADALTIVVSEETGKISFTSEGSIIPIKLSEFQEQLTSYLS